MNGRFRKGRRALREALVKIQSSGQPALAGNAATRDTAKVNGLRAETSGLRGALIPHMLEGFLWVFFFLFGNQERN